MNAQTNSNERLLGLNVGQISQFAIARSPYLYFLFWLSVISAGVLNTLVGNAALATPVQSALREEENTWEHQNTETLTLSEIPVVQDLTLSGQPLLSRDQLGEFSQNAVQMKVLEQSVSQPGVDATVIQPRLQSVDLAGTGGNLNLGAIAQNPESPNSPNNSSPSNPLSNVRRQGSEILGKPSIQLQGVYVLQGNESSARGRVNALYPVSPTALFGAVVDLTTGDAFSDSPGTGLRLNELYFAYAPFEQLPGLRFVVGLMDLTSYFDRNSFAKDGASHFFNRAFQTNPALSAAGLASRPGLLLNWSVTDNVEIKAAGFSSRRNLGRFSLDSFAAEAGFRTGNFILRSTFVTSRDSDQDTGFEEIYSLPRPGGFGVLDDDRENAFGINAEYYVPSLKLGFFARHGWYNNVSLGEGGTTYSFGMVRLDLFTRNDRLGIAYGRQLSNDDLRRDRDDKIPDVLEVYYDIPLAKFLRVGVTFQERNQFSETIIGFRIKTEFNVLGRLFE
ncbi:hypothetical protein [Leptothermofonsia sp. ETS-13]|uniref:hypothetical protein n=1 Tax=Leptothermofonsia sp. ETS-13 TaxID=3035696 RepID=UPI003BA3C46D